MVTAGTCVCREAVELAAARARQVCAEAYGYAPEVIIIGDTALSLPQVRLHFSLGGQVSLCLSLWSMLHGHRQISRALPVSMRLPRVREHAVCSLDNQKYSPWHMHASGVRCPAAGACFGIQLNLVLCSGECARGLRPL